MSYLTYLLIGHAAMVVHYLFFAYVVFGGFLSWRWPRMFWPHLLVAAYALGIVVIGWPCFLTDIENWSRLNTGREIMENGFIDHHITGVFYPAEHLMTSRYVIAGIVASAYAGLAWKLYRRRSAEAAGTVSG
jgi:Na+(H+)/acetate symporter ActP